MKIKIALAEDVPELRKSISSNLRLYTELDLIAVAQNGEELIRLIASEIPDLVLMDINMPVLNGIQATEIIRRTNPEIKIIMLTVFDDTDSIFKSILAGANGYLLKDAKPDKLIEAIHDSIEGGAPMSSSIAAKALQLIRTAGIVNNKTQHDFGLTNRENEILQLIASGKSYQIIAQTVFISPKTVRKHIENIYRKLQAHNKVEAVGIARNNGLI